MLSFQRVELVSLLYKNEVIATLVQNVTGNLPTAPPSLPSFTLCNLFFFSTQDIPPTLPVIQDTVIILYVCTPTDFAKK